MKKTTGSSGTNSFFRDTIRS